jgi:membrane-associated phospholipid phosphatase
VWIIAKLYPPHLRLELFFCVIYAALLGKIHYITSVTERPIPYMITSNSQDVIINLSLNQEYITPEEETIPDYLLVLLALVLPLLLMIGTGIALGYYHSNDRRHVALDVHSSLCTILIAFGSTAFFTNFFKYYVGYLRPNFYTMCNFDSATMTCNSNDDDITREARKSFPSGHASASFCGLLCLGLYLAGKVGLNHSLSLRSRSDNGTTTVTPTSRPNHAPWRKFVFLLALGGPLFLSTFVSASRVYDNWHHPADVVAGSLIGASSALVAYHLWYVLRLTCKKRSSIMSMPAL